MIVLLLSLGGSAIRSIVTLIDRLTAPVPLSRQTATLNPSLSDRGYIDLTRQLVAIALALAPVLLALYLLDRPRRTLGLGLDRPVFDLGWGFGLAAAIGLPGLLLVYVATTIGAGVHIVPAALGPEWWSVPVLVLSAIENAVLEEVIVVGYLITRLQGFGWRLPAVIAASAVLRGSYHLYQGFGGFVGNVVMGIVFALFFLRVKRVTPLIVAHSLLDIVAFVGYTLLPKAWLSWL